MEKEIPESNVLLAPNASSNKKLKNKAQEKMISKEVEEMTAMVKKLQNIIKINRELLNQVQNG